MNKNLYVKTMQYQNNPFTGKIQNKITNMKYNLLLDCIKDINISMKIQLYYEKTYKFKQRYNYYAV